VEGNFNVAGSYGTTGKDEISVWTWEDSSEFARKTEAKAIPMKHDEIFLLS
jgi:phenylacetate-coenzyme A ligase PaaK-like adenylate-forming protein